MSVWTQVSITMKFPEPISKETLVETFGKQLNLKYAEPRNFYRRVDGKIFFNNEGYKKAVEECDEHNRKEWEAYEGHEEEYLPTGSEGSLEYMPCRRSARKTDGMYKYEIAGALRDYSNDEYIVKWFRDKFLGLTLKHDDWTFKTYAKVSASMGVGELTWEYGKYDE